MIVILATLHQKEMAHKVGKQLLEKHLIACYNLSSIESAYWWKGELLQENETLLIMKTKDENFDAIEQHFMEHSGYEVPELIAISPSKVNKPYEDWVNQEANGNG